MPAAGEGQDKLPSAGQCPACHQCWPGLCTSMHHHQLQGIVAGSQFPHGCWTTSLGLAPSTSPPAFLFRNSLCDRQFRAAPTDTPVGPAAVAGDAGAAESPSQPLWWGTGFSHGSQSGWVAGRGLPPDIPLGLLLPLVLRGASPASSTAHMFRKIRACNLGYCLEDRCPVRSSVACSL